MAMAISWSAVNGATLTALLLLTVPANAQSIAGSYVGQYECGQSWRTFGVELTGSRNSKFTAKASFPNQVINTNGFNARNRMQNRGESIEMEVESSASSSFAIRTESKIILIQQESREQVRLTGSRQANGFLTGELDYPGCGRFVLVPNSSQNAALTAQQYINQLRQTDQRRAREGQMLAAREARLRSGWVSPELRPTGGTIEYPNEPLEYYDVTLGRAADPFEDIRPVDRIMQQLVDQSYKCIGTAQVSWRGNEGTATSSLFGTKVYLIQCDGDCDELTYKSPSGGSHFGKSLPYPAVQLSGRFLASATPINWQFSHSDETREPPRVRVHTWSNQLGDYGGQCVID